MRVIETNTLPSDRIIECPSNGFVSHRILLEKDNMGYGMTKTIVPVNGKQHWHYKNHLESCYCVAGEGVLTNIKTEETYRITPDTTYILDQNDDHYFEAIEETTLICIFNPPLIGSETHNSDGSYPASREWESPVYNVLAMPMDRVKANDYNPNKVAPPEMELLETSIWEDGYTQPVVTYWDNEQDMYIVVDGFHRWRTMRESKRIMDREKGVLPIVVIDKEIGERMASTIRHNRARGSHNIELMSGIVAELVDIGKSDRWICKHIGMSPDELLRLKQITGLASLFSNSHFNDSWNAEDVDSVEIEEEKTLEV